LSLETKKRKRKRGNSGVENDLSLSEASLIKEEDDKYPAFHKDALPPRIAAQLSRSSNCGAAF